MSWRTAKSLLQLRAEVDARWPDRAKAADGTIGDTAHRARASRHNPNQLGVVTALDLTHDPVYGPDVHQWAREHVKNPHPELAYIISNGQIWSTSMRYWRTYRGSNPHTRHIHVAVGRGPDSQPQPPYDSTVSWGVANVSLEGDPEMNELVKHLQTSLKASGHDPGPIDGLWGPRTQEALVRALSGSGNHTHQATVKLS